MKKCILIILILLLIISVMCVNKVYAISEIKAAMTGVGDPSAEVNSDTAKLINTVIGLIQFVGTGISLIVISILGIKYLIASPSEKADVKKNIMPIIIGCVLLFAAVHIVGIIENFTSANSLVGG